MTHVPEISVENLSKAYCIGLRDTLLGKRPMPWNWIAIGSLSASGLLLTGLMCFRRREHLFADVA